MLINQRLKQQAQENQIEEMENIIKRNGCPQGFIPLSQAPIAIDEQIRSRDVWKLIVKTYPVSNTRYTVQLSEGRTSWATGYDINDLTLAASQFINNCEQSTKTLVEHKPTGKRFKYSFKLV